MSQKNTIADWHAVSDAGNAGNNGVSASLHESVFCICSLGDHQVVAPLQWWCYTERSMTTML